MGCLFIGVVALPTDVALAQQEPKAPSSASKFAAQVVPSTQQAGQTQIITVPSPEVLLVLVRSALIALDHANRAGNYTVLRELGGPGLQRHSSAELSSAFAKLRRVDLLPVAVITPQLTQTPSVSPEGLLRMVGFFPIQPRKYISRSFTKRLADSGNYSA